MKYIYTTIPVELCTYALRNRKVNHMLLYVYLKHISSGHLRYDTSLYKIWAVDLDLSERTIRDCVKWLIRDKIITVNTKKSRIRVIGYKQLHKKLDFISFSAVRYEPDDFSGFYGFCCASVICYYLHRKKFSDKKRRSESKMADSSKSRYSYPKGYYPFPIEYLAKCIDVSKSTANNYIRTAEAAGYITIKSQTSYLLDEKGNTIPANLMTTFKQNDKEYAKRLRVKKGQLVVIESNLILCHFSTLRKRFKYKEKL